MYNKTCKEHSLQVASGKLGKGENMEQMGMTDKQFNGFIRFLIDDLKEAKEEENTEKKNARIQKILENLQSTLED